MRRFAKAFAVSVALGATVIAAAPSQAAPHAGKRTVNATFGAAPASEKLVHGKKVLGVDGRPYFTFGTTPGGRLTDHLAILNISYKPETLQVYPVDAVAAANGTIAYAAPSAPRKQAGAWLAVGTPGGSGRITVKPRSTVIVPVHVAVPRNAPPGDHVGAVVVSLSGRIAGSFGQGSKQKVKFDQRIAVKALFRVTGPLHPQLSVQQLHASYRGPIDPFAKGQATVTYTVHNGGNVILGGPQTVTVHGLFGESVTAAHVADVPALLPGASYPVTVKVPGVYPEVWMSAKVTVDTTGLQGQVDPGLHPVTASVHFLAIPWILLVVLLLLILGLAWGYARRRRRKRPVEPSRDLAKPQGVRT